MRLWQQGMIHLARNRFVKDFMQKKSGMSELSNRFVGGKDPKTTINKAIELRKKGIYSSLFYLGEYVDDEKIINETISHLQSAAGFLSKSDLDIHISVDPTQIGNEVGRDLCFNNAQILAETIKEYSKSKGEEKNLLMIDMEDSSVTKDSIDLYNELLNSSFEAGITLQAYLFRTENDLLEIIDKGGVVRLVKGAFAEGSNIAFTDKRMIDSSFLRLSKIMLSAEARNSGFYPVFATHDDRIIDKIINIAKDSGWKKGEYEFEMLYGVREKYQNELVKKGEKLRLYLPFGTDWWPYAVRRVGESPRNFKFLLKALVS